MALCTSSGYPITALRSRMCRILFIRYKSPKSKCKSVCRWSPFFQYCPHAASRSGKRRERSESNGRYKRCVGRLHLERSEILCNGVKQPKLNKKSLRSPLYAQTQPNPKAVTETYSATAFRPYEPICDKNMKNFPSTTQTDKFHGTENAIICL